MDFWTSPKDASKGGRSAIRYVSRTIAGRGRPAPPCQITGILADTTRLRTKSTVGIRSLPHEWIPNKFAGDRNSEGQATKPAPH
jgi:hypothetical protein